MATRLSFETTKALTAKKPNANSLDTGTEHFSLIIECATEKVIAIYDAIEVNLT
jgi:hypothetical protein